MSHIRDFLHRAELCRRRAFNKTSDGLSVYDLDVNASCLWVVAGPPGFDPACIDPDDLPEGFRWVSDEEWETLDPA